MTPDFLVMIKSRANGKLLQGFQLLVQVIHFQATAALGFSSLTLRRELPHWNCQLQRYKRKGLSLYNLFRVFKMLRTFVSSAGNQLLIMSD